MKEQELLSDQQFADMYNLGYGLNKLSPEMADLIVQVKTKSPQLDAIKAGIQKANEPEREQNYLPDWLKDDWFKESDKDMTKNKHRNKDRD